MTKPRLLVIRNLVAGKAGSAFARRALAALAELAEIVIQDTTGRGDAETMARQAMEFERVIIAGGDGTIGEALAGLLARTDAPPPIGIVPVGTANVLAAELGYPTDAEDLARLLALGPIRRIYPGLANGRPFAVMTSVGFDAHVVAGISPRLKTALGKGVYVVEAFRQLFRFGFPGYVATIDGRSYDAASLVIARGRFYGGRFVICPEAKLAQPIFQVALLEHNGPIAAFGHAIALGLGFLPRLTRRIEAKVIEITEPKGDPVQADGDVIARLPLRVEISPKMVEIVAGTLGQAA